MKQASKAMRLDWLLAAVSRSHESKPHPQDTHMCSPSPKYCRNVEVLPVQARVCRAHWQLSRVARQKQTGVFLRVFHSLFLDMLPAGPSDGYHPTRSSPRSSIHRSIRGKASNHLRREDRRIPVEPPTQARNTRTRIWPSAARTFLQRTLARVLRQPKQTSQRGLVSPPRRAFTLDIGPLSEPSDTSLRLSGRNHLASLTPLVLQRTDDVAFSPSSFFRRVEEIRALDSGLGDPLVPSQLLPPRRPPSGPHRRQPPPIDEASDQPMPHTSSSLSRNPTLSQTTLRKRSPRAKLRSVLELQALAMELNKLDPLLDNSPPPPLAPHCLQNSPSIKSLRPRSRLLSTSPLEARNPSRDPLAELLAVADELKTMKNLDSDDILYMTDALPPSPLPPILHAFFDAPGAPLHILEMDVYSEDEMFLGVPIPCIVVTSERDSLHKEKLEIHDPPPSPSEDLLAPPPATYRGRVETDPPPIITNGDSERSPSPSPTLSPPPTLPSREDTANGDEETGGSLSPPCYCPACGLGDGNLSWEVIGMARSLEPSSQCTKPGRPTAPKPTPLLRRRERSLLRRMLGGGDECNSPLVEKDMSGCIPSKRKRKRIPKDAIGSPRPLSSAGQMT